MVRPIIEWWQTLKDKIPDVEMFIVTTHICHMSADCHREGRALGLSLYELNSMAPEKQMTCAQVHGEGYPCPLVSPQSFTVVARGNKCASWPTSSSLLKCAANFQTHQAKFGVVTQEIAGKRHLISSNAEEIWVSGM